MAPSVAERCRICFVTLKSIVFTLTTDGSGRRISSAQASDELERFSLWTGNIGALHQPSSALSVESRLHEALDILHYIFELLDDLSEALDALLQIVSGRREGERVTETTKEGSIDGQGDEFSEENELLGEMTAGNIARLFRVSSLIRQAAPSNIFDKALSRNCHQFNDHFDIAHVGEKYPKLAIEGNQWLQIRLGRAITQRRHYLSYIRNHRDRLEGIQFQDGQSEAAIPKTQIAQGKQVHSERLIHETESRQSTYYTKASTLNPAQVTRSLLSAEVDTGLDNDARSYTTISHSVDGELESAATIKIPQLADLQVGSTNTVECPFCFRFKKFRNDRIRRRHVFEDIRSYVCTFPECNIQLFSDINEWFQHEMQNHRTNFICTICKDRNISSGHRFSARERYIAHIQRQHPHILEAEGLELLIETSQRPVKQIPVQACPFCSDWEIRLQEHNRTDGVVCESHTEASIISVLPQAFKRHVAAHLEELGLFAIPNGSVTGNSVGSNDAIEEAGSSRARELNLSELEFTSIGNSEYEAQSEDKLHVGADDDLASPTMPNRMISWFLSGDGIEFEFTSAVIKRYFGPDTLVKRVIGTEEYQERPGYWISSHQTPTSQMKWQIIQDSRISSQYWQLETNLAAYEQLRQTGDISKNIGIFLPQGICFL